MICKIDVKKNCNHDHLPDTNINNIIKRYLKDPTKINNF